MIFLNDDHNRPCISSLLAAYINNVNLITDSFILRSVKSLALSRGGIEVKIVTYAPFGSHRRLTVPLSNMSALAARNG